MKSITTASPKPARKSASKSKPSKQGQETATQAQPNLEESFTMSTRQQSELHLKEEHQTKIDVQNQLHRARLEAIRSQLQLQLYTIWNEIWLQRQKSFTQLHKEWLKVFTS